MVETTRIIIFNIKPYNCAVITMQVGKYRLRMVVKIVRRILNDDLQSKCNTHQVLQFMANYTEKNGQNIIT